jgi:thymidylate synthase ThyX
MTQATAVVIADSISSEGIRLTTFQLRYWRPIHSELMTHRVFSRNAGSSRARPSAKIIDQVWEAPWGPIHWGLNQPGMQAEKELSEADIAKAKDIWLDAAREAVYQANRMVHLGVHKQIVNRLLEPFTYIDVLVTATDFANWYALRNHPDAQPEIAQLAQLMLKAQQDSTPKRLESGEWHLPYISSQDWEAALLYCDIRVSKRIPPYLEQLDVVRKVSVARCARVSYKAFDGTVAPIKKDIELFNQLLVSEPLHASPAEHQATPDVWAHGPNGYPAWQSHGFHGNFRGWNQYRKMLPNEFVPG